MAKPKGLPKTGGRKPGSLNAGTAELRELARQHAPAAISALVEIVQNPESSQRAQAASILLDRAYGRVRPMEEPDISDILESLEANDITALTAALRIESRGASLPKSVEMLLQKELNAKPTDSAEKSHVQRFHEIMEIAMKNSKPWAEAAKEHQERARANGNTLSS